MEKQKVSNKLIILFWLFIIGSILGFIFETIVVLFQKGHFELRQGLIYGPFIPVYGIGAVIYYLILNNINIKSKWKIFLITMVLGGVTEYICSLVQEKVFGTVSWDYSYLPFNFNGRTSLLHCTYWGIAGVLYITFVVPLLRKIEQKADRITLKVFTLMFSILILFDITISCLASYRQNERRRNLAPDRKLEVILDTYYPDEYLDKIYTNKKEV